VSKEHQAKFTEYTTPEELVRELGDKVGDVQNRVLKFSTSYGRTILVYQDKKTRLGI
jgi:hypothetical protein